MSLQEIEKEIKALQQKAAKLRAGKGKGLKIVLAAMKEYGLSAADVAEAAGKPARRGRPPGRKTGPAKGGKVAVKFKHGSDTWTGRGRTPRWLVALEKEGRKREEFRV
ncbi:MAG: H-NS family nucleoid-associated regulatory protein [Alphaproteobacteria bacterium]